MPSLIITRDEVWEGDDLSWTLAQIVGKNSALLQQADVVSITVFVYDKTKGTQLYTAVFGPAGIITDFPVKDDRWTDDNIGYNFSHYLDHDTVFAITPMEGMHTYRTEYVVETTPLSGSGDLRVLRETLCRPAKST